MKMSWPYYRAAFFSQLGPDQFEEAIQDYHQFLKYHPIDDKRVPSAHYYLGYLYFVQQNFELAKNHYEKGVEAEAVRLPCFPPIETSFEKGMLQLHFRMPKPSSK
eukprot:TRINITY_DN10200_c0_g1_i3.p1 TRINITY_DN10200_c0_g1~~TRINITY_DN10200_c0_g1_i3.p1  ORF type:complete len:105 (+),score=13.56 TRINITY_DN10200_c0_g1_i3:167-481(+)